MFGIRKRNRAQARLADEQARLARAERKETERVIAEHDAARRADNAAGRPWYAQPTVRDALKARGQKH